LEDNKTSVTGEPIPWLELQCMYLEPQQNDSGQTMIEGK
jgi:hypothetical protein